SNSIPSLGPSICFLFLLPLAASRRQDASQEWFQTSPALCQLPPAGGPCKAALRRYYYNSTSTACEPFMYGGCQGNANNFETPLKMTPAQPQALTESWLSCPSCVETLFCCNAPGLSQ
uniref:BPTI/Kunitz inhibitor domain-containing protein n=1 Tax=Catagonus wagneri TaxID=51154 RepID=A0A8C3YCS6_9CETA